MERAPSFFEQERDGPIIIWKFNNPPQNLWNAGTGAEFEDLVETFYATPDLRVGIITSALPSVFIRHYDVSVLVSMSQALRGGAPALEPPVPRGVRRRGPKPIIAAINAPVAGGDCVLTLFCDFRIMARTATIGLPEVNGGIIPTGGIQLMTRLVGMSQALEMMLLGKRISADEAKQIGLIHRACEPYELMPVAMALAKELANKPPLAVAHIRRCVYEGIDMTFQDALVLERRLFFETLQSEDALRIMSAYVTAGQTGDLPQM